MITNPMPFFMHLETSSLQLGDSGAVFVFDTETVWL